MAKYYATFDQSTDSALNGAGYTRVGYGDAISDYTSTDRADMLTKRAALSAAFTAVIDTVNNDGSRNPGIIAPLDSLVIGGSTVSATQLYTNNNVSPGNRPGLRPTVANSVGVSPTDAWSITKSTYDAAVAACTLAWTRAQLYLFLGPNPDRTLRNANVNAAETALFWDDGTYPSWGTPCIITLTPTPPGTGNATFTVSVFWGVNVATVLSNYVVKINLYVDNQNSFPLNSTFTAVHSGMFGPFPNVQELATGLVATAHGSGHTNYLQASVDLYDSTGVTLVTGVLSNILSFAN